MVVDRELRNKIAYMLACISEFARRNNIGTQMAYEYVADHGGMKFLRDYYDVEHTLSFDEAIDDIEAICKQNGGEL